MQQLHLEFQGSQQRKGQTSLVKLKGLRGLVQALGLKPVAVLFEKLDIGDMAA